MERDQPVTAISRRGFLSAALVGLTPKSGRPLIGGFVHDSHERGHRLRDGVSFDAPGRIDRRLLEVPQGNAALALAHVQVVQERIDGLDLLGAAVGRHQDRHVHGAHAAAALFVEWALTKEGQQAFVDAGYTPVREDLQHAPDVEAIPIDVEALAADEERWQSEWEAIVNGATPVHG